MTKQDKIRYIKDWDLKKYQGVKDCRLDKMRKDLTTVRKQLNKIEKMVAQDIDDADYQNHRLTQGQIDLDAVIWCLNHLTDPEEDN